MGGEGSSRRNALLLLYEKWVVVAGVGLARLLELIENREAISAGTVIPIHGITREADEADETPHRHTFSARFVVTSVSRSAIIHEVYFPAHRFDPRSHTGGPYEYQHNTDHPAHPNPDRRASHLAV
jgi:hypothetical protein